jgi:hypothetical protein
MQHRHLGLALLAACFPASAQAQQAFPPIPGDLAVSEILFNSATSVDDNDGEYFEVTNLSSKVLDLNGLYFQDLETTGSATAPYVLIPAGALPPLYPGKAYVFARSGNPALNGGIPVVDYAYSVPTGQSAPSDHSKVSHTAMALSNSAIDAVVLTSQAPANLGGFVIEGVTFDPTKAPMVVSSGIAFERGDLLQPWMPANVAASTAPFGTASQVGTPGSWNSNDSTLYPTWSKYAAVSPGAADSGLLSAVGPASVSSGLARLRLENGPPAALFAIGFSSAPAQAPFADGTLLIDFASAVFWDTPTLLFDGTGAASLDVALSAPLLGAQFHLQWISYDFSVLRFVFSNGLMVDICP